MVRVHSYRAGVKKLLGTAPAGRTTALRTFCNEFRNRRTDFMIRPLAGEQVFVPGDMLKSCADSLVLWIPATGTQFANVTPWPRR